MPFLVLNEARKNLFRGLLMWLAAHCREVPYFPSTVRWVRIILRIKPIWTTRICPFTTLKELPIFGRQAPHLVDKEGLWRIWLMRSHHVCRFCRSWRSHTKLLSPHLHIDIVLVFASGWAWNKRTMKFGPSEVGGEAFYRASPGTTSQVADRSCAQSCRLLRQCNLCRAWANDISVMADWRAAEPPGIAILALVCAQ